MADDGAKIVEKMSDFAKVKIGFAVALLAALYTVQPALDGIKSFSLSLFGQEIPFSWLYYSMGGALTLSVYFYACAFVSERVSSESKNAQWILTWVSIISENIGNFLYALSLLIPVIYAVGGILEIFFYFGAKLVPIFSSDSWLRSAIGSIIAVIGGFLSGFLSIALKRRDRQSMISALDLEEKSLLGKAADLFRAGNYNFAIIQAFQAIEFALRKALIGKNADLKFTSPRFLIDTAARLSILKPDEVEKMHTMRKLRNEAAHNPQPLSQEQADFVLKCAFEILANLEETDDDQD